MSVLDELNMFYVHPTFWWKSSAALVLYRLMKKCIHSLLYIFFPYKSMYMLLHVATYHQYLQHFTTVGTIHKQYSQLFTVFVWKMTGSHNISVIVNLFVELCFWKFSCRYKVLCSHRKLSVMWNVKSIHASVRKEEVLYCSLILEGDAFMWSLCFSFCSTRGRLSFYVERLSEVWHSSFRENTNGTTI